MKNQSMETDSEMTKMIKLADKHIKHMVINMHHMLKYWKKHKYNEERNIRHKRKPNEISSSETYLKLKFYRRG